jgi:acyl transferase domain-containing protein
MPVQSLKGSRTAVFGASMTDDYQKQVSKDPETMPRMNLAGNAFSILPNRLSWYFDLLGPSVHVDTACSSSLVALDLACQSLRSGDADSVGYLPPRLISLVVPDDTYLFPGLVKRLLS